MKFRNYLNEIEPNLNLLNIASVIFSSHDRIISDGWKLVSKVFRSNHFLKDIFTWDCKMHVCALYIVRKVFATFQFDCTIQYEIGGISIHLTSSWWLENTDLTKCNRSNEKGKSAPISISQMKKIFYFWTWNKYVNPFSTSTADFLVKSFVLWYKSPVGSARTSKFSLWLQGFWSVAICKM